LSLTSKHPTGILRFFLRLPVVLYHVHLGWLLGQRFLLLTHTGRKSGKQRRVVVEVVTHNEVTGAYYIASGWRGKSDWFRNILVNPRVSFTVRRHTRQADASVVNPGEAGELFLAYARRYPVAFRELCMFMVGERLQANEADCARLAESVPRVKLTPLAELDR
jgi:deazaflavin-dependent oxidoreductase (nitroreductase family)